MPHMTQVAYFQRHGIYPLLIIICFPSPRPSVIVASHLQ